MSNREEAPDGGLFHQVLGDHGGGEGTSEVEDEALEDHTLLFVHGEEGGEHQEGVDTSAHNVVGGVSHGDGPAKVDHRLSLEGAELLTAEPFGGGLREGGGPFRDEGHGVAEPEEEATEEAEALDDLVVFVVLLELVVVFSGELGVGEVAERLVDDVAEVGLEADVDEAQHGEDLVDHGFTDGVSEASGEEEVLDGLEEFHGEEEEDTRSEHAVAGAGMNPPGREETNSGEATRHVSVETHFLKKVRLFLFISLFY